MFPRILATFILASLFTLASVFSHWQLGSTDPGTPQPTVVQKAGPLVDPTTGNGEGNGDGG